MTIGVLFVNDPVLHPGVGVAVGVAVGNGVFVGVGVGPPKGGKAMSPSCVSAGPPSVPMNVGAPVVWLIVANRFIPGRHTQHVPAPGDHVQVPVEV